MTTPTTVKTSATCAEEANTNSKELEQTPAAFNGTEFSAVCPVCGDKNASPGGLGCKPCQKFFQRHSKSRMTYKCLKEENCTIDIETRRCCNFCRYRKCLAVGFGQKIRPTPKRTTPTLSKTELIKLINQNSENAKNGNKFKPEIQNKSPNDQISALNEPVLPANMTTINSHTIPTYVVEQEQNGSNKFGGRMANFSPYSGFGPATILQTDENDSYFQCVVTNSSSDMTESDTQTTPSNSSSSVQHSSTELQEKPILFTPKPTYGARFLGQTPNFSAFHKYAGANKNREVDNGLRNGILAANQVNSDLSESATLPNQEVNEPTENDQNGCWTCSECGTKIGSLRQLKEHICSEHLSNWQPYQCQFCLRRCPTAENMIGHFDEMHPYFVPKFQFVDSNKEKSIAFEKLFESSVKLGFH